MGKLLILSELSHKKIFSILDFLSDLCSSIFKVARCSTNTARNATCTTKLKKKYLTFPSAVSSALK